MRSNTRYKPIYKYFQKLRENVCGTVKLLNFKKKKWANLIKKLTPLKKKFGRSKSFSFRYAFFNHNALQISRNPKPFKNLYRSQLAAKQRLNIYYGKLTNNQLKKLSRVTFIKSKLKIYDQDNSALFINSLESRLSSVLFRTHFVSNVNTARQWITYGNIYVNQKKITSCNFLLKSGDLVEVSNKLHPIIKANILKSKVWPVVPLHLEINFKILSIYFVNNVDISNLSGHFPFWLNLKNIVLLYK